jgi:hypothetical protein
MALEYESNTGLVGAIKAPLGALGSDKNYRQVLYETIAEQVEGLGRRPNANYNVGEVVYPSSNLQYALTCTTEGTSATADLDISANTEGDTITDGTVAWKVVKRNHDAELVALALRMTAAESDIVSTNGKLAPLIYNSAAAHNAIFRGRYLGDHVTDEQWAAIKAGTFEGLYIGDYWTINGVDYVIAAFDYYLNCGDTKVTVHHITLVPRKNLYNHVMNDTNVVTGAYVGSKMYASGLNTAKTTIASAFGSGHILTIRQLYSNATDSTYGYGTSFAWYDASVFLMDEVNVYGCYVFTERYRTTQWGSDKYSIDNSQYPVFAFDKTMIHTRQDYWLRNVVYSTTFAQVASTGRCSLDTASSAFGVRPAFNIYQS